MHIETFKYTKANGETSTRRVLVTTEPTTLLGGYDMSELSATEQEHFARAVKEAHDAYFAESKSLCNKFDMNYRYRNFKPANISGSTKTSI